MHFSFLAQICQWNKARNYQINTIKKVRFYFILCGIMQGISITLRYNVAVFMFITITLMTILKTSFSRYYIRKYKKKDFTFKEYWDSIVDLKRDFDIEERMN